MILFMVACDTPIVDVKHTRDTATAGDDTADSGEDSDSGDTEDTDVGTEDGLDTVLDALRADRDGTLRQYAWSDGWPLVVDDGVLFVYAETGGWKAAGDFDGWVGQTMNEEDDFSWLWVEDAADGYKFTRGDTWNPDPWARRYTYDDFGEMSLVTATGAHLERLPQVGDGTLSARTLHIWVPSAAPTRVLYMHDGQNLFDPEAMWGGWRVQDAAPNDVLIVGIENTGDRMEEYTHVADELDGEPYGGWGDDYADFIQDTVRPLIDDVYGEPAIVGTLGSSLGGLISLHIADRYPADYAFAGSMSGTLGWGSFELHNETMIERWAAGTHRDVVVYLDSGGSGTTCADSDSDGVNDDDMSAGDNYCETLQMRDTLAGLGWQYDVDLWHWWEPDAEHNEVAWAERVSMPLAIFADL